MFCLSVYINYNSQRYKYLLTNSVILCLRDFMMSRSDDKQADIIDASNSASNYLDEILNINYVSSDNMIRQIYPSKLQLNKANTSDTKTALFWTCICLFLMML